MPIQDTDLLLIEDTSGASKKIEASKLKANLAANTYNNYKLLVNKPDYSSGFVYAQNMQASVTPTDYMLIERAGVSYKVTGQHIIDYFPSVPAGAAGPITDVVNTTESTLATTVTFRYIVSPSGPAPTYSWSQGVDEQTVAIGTNPLSGTNVKITMWKLDTKSYCAYYNTGINAWFNLYTSETGAANSWVPCSACGALGNSTTPVETTAKGTYFLAIRTTEGSCSTTAGEVMSRHNYYVVASSNVYKESTLTLASDTNLDTFTVSDSINMVDENGDVASYTPVTSTITNVDSIAFVTTGTWGPYNQTPEATGDPTVLFKTQGGYNYSNAITDYEYLNHSFNNSELITFDPPLTHTSNIQMWAMAQVNAGPLLINDGAVSIPWKTATIPGDTLFEWIDTGVTEIRNIKVNQTSSSGMICGIQFFSKTQDISTAFVSGSGLTFASPNKDLKYFNPGDVVGEDMSKPGTYLGYSASGYSETSVRQIAISDATYQGEFTYGTNPSGGPNNLGAVLFDLKYSLDKVEFGSLDNSANLVMELYASDTGLQDSWVLEATGNTNSDGKGTVKSTSPHRFFKLIKTSGYGSMGFQYWGVDTSSMVGVPVEVISTDIAANTMVVDGGNWEGSDGSGTGPNQSRVWSADTTFSNLSNEENIKKLFDGSFSNTSYGTSSTNQTITFDPPIVGTTFEISDAQAAGFNPVYTINGNSKTGVGVSNSPTSFNFTDISSIVVGGSLSEVVYSVNSGSSWTPGLNGIRVDGKLLVDTGLFEAPSTEVTAPVKSGTGNFSGNTGPVVDVSNSNQEWIDNDNRLGESFFIKSASTRTGLAILRTKAISQSQAWAADAGYSAEQLVKHNGRYWLALSSSYGNSPDETDTLDWFDLGLES